MNRVYKISQAIEKFKPSAQFIEALYNEFNSKIDFSFVAGSGLSSLTSELTILNQMSYSEIPGLFSSSVMGHSGTLQLVESNGVKCLFFSGRVHLYEGFSVIDTIFPVVISYLLDIKNIVITNAVGGLNINFKAGELMIIETAINLMYRSIVNDIQIEGMCNNPNNKFKSVCINRGIEFTSGSMAAVTGPSYETPAEIRAFRKLGADAMGMSTVLEIKAAEILKMNVMGLSLITNKLKDTATMKISHEEVIDVAKLAEQKFKKAFLACFELFIPNTKV